MKKIGLIVGLFFIIIACDDISDNDPVIVSGEKVVTENIPSTDKLIKEGEAYTPAVSMLSENSVLVGEEVVPNVDAVVTYNGLERLYDTVWYQTESDVDDGVIEVETEFIFFDSRSWIVEQEVETENGIQEEPAEFEYGQITWLDNITSTSRARPDGSDMNVFVALNENRDDDGIDRDYEAYWLYDNTTLYVVDGDTQAEAIAEMILILSNPNSISSLEDHYILSVDPNAQLPDNTGGNN